MALVKAPIKPPKFVLLWWVWTSNKNIPLEGYFLGLLYRKNGTRKDLAIAIYDESSSKIWIAFLRGSLYRVEWENLLYKRVQITYQETAIEKGFKVLYDPEDTLDEIPEVDFKGKFAGFKFIRSLSEIENESEPEEPKKEEEINEANLPF
jgi:hypothetical protein